jgi:hypothetical protein
LLPCHNLKKKQVTGVSSELWFPKVLDIDAIGLFNDIFYFKKYLTMTISISAISSTE